MHRCAKNAITVVSKKYEALEQRAVERSRELVREVELVELGHKVCGALNLLKCDGGLRNSQKVICATE